MSTQQYLILSIQLKSDIFALKGADTYNIAEYIL